MRRAETTKAGNRAKRTKTPRHGVCTKDRDAHAHGERTRHTPTAAHWMRIARAALFDIDGKGVRNVR